MSVTFREPELDVAENLNFNKKQKHVRYNNELNNSIRIKLRENETISRDSIFVKSHS